MPNVAKAAAKAYAMELARTHIKMPMGEFFQHIHSKFHPDQDISFMEYFLELSQSEEEFPVEHDKLHTFGIMTSTHSGDIKKKLDKLNLKIDKDYLLGHMSQQSETSRGVKHSNQYMLTADAFKKCLMRARKYANQPIDPTIYCDYYLLLEEVFKLYTDYERQYAKCLLAIKDDKIDQMSSEIKVLLIENKQQSVQIDKILAHTNHIMVQNDHQSNEIKQLHYKLDRLFEYLLSFAHMTIPTWIGSAVLKKQYDTLAKTQTTSYALTHLKVMFMVAFFEPLDEDTRETVTIDGVERTFTACSHMRIYFCCTNFADVRARIKSLYRKYTDGDNAMYMCQPLVVTLISCEINLERIILENSNIFPTECTSVWNRKFKRFDLLVPAQNYVSCTATFESICEKATSERFQGYQMRINEFTESADTKIDQKIIEYINGVDREFFASTKPFCQQYINCYTKPVYTKDGELAEYAFNAPGRIAIKRPDLGNRGLTNTQYSLTKVKHLLINSNKVDHIQIMATQGILSKDDLPGLKAMAKFEQIDVSELVEPSDSESDRE